MNYLDKEGNTLLITFNKNKLSRGTIMKIEKNKSKKIGKGITNVGSIQFEVIPLNYLLDLRDDINKQLMEIIKYE